MQYPVVLDTRTFAVRGTDGKIATWVGDWLVGDVPMGLARLTISHRPPVKGSSVHRVTAKIVVPHLASFSDSSLTGYVPDNKVAYFEQAEVTFLLSEKSIANDRSAILQMVSDLCGTTGSNALYKAVREFHVVDFEEPA